MIQKWIKIKFLFIITSGAGGVLQNVLLQTPARTHTQIKPENTQYEVRSKRSNIKVGEKRCLPLFAASLLEMAFRTHIHTLGNKFSLSLSLLYAGLTCGGGEYVNTRENYLNRIMNNECGNNGTQESKRKKTRIYANDVNASELPVSHKYEMRRSKRRKIIRIFPFISFFSKFS